VGVVPVGSSDVVEAEPKQERLQAELGGLERDAGRIARAGDIADGFILDGRDVDAREIPRTEEPRELDGVAAIVLHPVAGLLGNQRRRYDTAFEALAGQVALKHVTARAGLVGEHQLRRLTSQPPHQLVDVALPGPDLPHEVRWLGRAPRGVGDADRLFVNVQTDKNRSRLWHG